MKMVKVDQKIVGYKVVKDDEPKRIEEVKMNYKVKRDRVLSGSTYKIKNPLDDNAMYITINNLTLESGEVRPFEMFINSKNMDHFQWVVALTRLISAIFRQGGKLEFLAEELKSVFDPKGGYFKKGGTFIPSLVAEIGSVIEGHLCTIGILDKPELDDDTKAFIKQKREEYDGDVVEEEADSFPAGATLCSKCNKTAVIIMDGCATCLNCGDSKCG